jgi:hypothetical protein
VLDRIAALAATPAPRLRVLDLGGGRAAALPGGTLVLDRAAVTAGPEAGAIAGWIAAARAGEDPVAALMRAAGPWAELRHIFTGDPGPAAIARGAAAVRAAARTMEDPGAAPGAPPLSAGEAAALRDVCG